MNVLHLDILWKEKTWVRQGQGKAGGGPAQREDELQGLRPEEPEITTDTIESALPYETGPALISFYYTYIYFNLDLFVLYNCIYYTF